MPGSRARSVASSRSNSSIWCADRLAHHRRPGRALAGDEREVGALRVHVLDQHRRSERSMMSVERRARCGVRRAASRAATRTTRRPGPGRARRWSRSAGRTRSARCRPPWPPAAATARRGCCSSESSSAASRIARRVRSLRSAAGARARGPPLMLRGERVCTAPQRVPGSRRSALTVLRST